MPRFRWTRSHAAPLMLALILVVAAGLRLRGYASYPPLTGWPDELAWSWSGLTLITNHYPSGYSALAAYPHREIVSFAGLRLPVVRPWLDDPPVFSLLIGGSAWLGGARRITEVSPAWDRLPPLALSLVALVLMYVLGGRVIGRRAALLAAAAFAVAPPAVAFARQPASEVLLAPLLLALLIALERYLDGSAGWLWVALAACLLGPLVKVPGIALAGAAATILALRGRWSGALACVLAGALGLAAFAAYGLALDWSTFAAVQREQAGRLLGPSGAFDFFVGPSYYALPIDSQHVVHDGWWILGLVGLGAMLFHPDRRPAELLAWPVVAYAGTILLLGSGHVFTYYHLAVYPLAYLAAGRIALQALKDLSVPGLGLVIGLSAATIRIPGLPAPALPWLVGVLILAVVGSAAMAVWRDSWTTAAARRLVAWGALGIVIGGNLAASALLTAGSI